MQVAVLSSVNCGWAYVNRTHDGPKKHAFPCVYALSLVLIIHTMICSPVLVGTRGYTTGIMFRACRRPSCTLGRRYMHSLSLSAARAAYSSFPGALRRTIIKSFFRHVFPSLVRKGIRPATIPGSMDYYGAVVLLL